MDCADFHVADLAHIQEGEKADGSDSYAKQVAEAEDWPLEVLSILNVPNCNFEVLICVVSDKKKAVSSTSGMQTSIATSPLLAVHCSILGLRLTSASTHIGSSSSCCF